MFGLRPIRPSKYAEAAVMTPRSRRSICRPRTPEESEHSLPVLLDQVANVRLLENVPGLTFMFRSIDFRNVDTIQLTTELYMDNYLVLGRRSQIGELSAERLINGGLDVGFRSVGCDLNVYCMGIRRCVRHSGAPQAHWTIERKPTILQGIFQILRKNPMERAHRGQGGRTIVGFRQKRSVSMRR